VQVKLAHYSFEACCAAVLRRRVPAIPHTQIARWFAAGELAAAAAAYFAWSVFVPSSANEGAIM
jgi:hypothetical protein